MKVNTSIPVQFEVLENDNDTRFFKVKIFIAHTQENLNGSYFSKEALEILKDSLANVPILGYIQIDEKNETDYKGHENIIVITDDSVELKYQGRAYGLVPENNNAQFEIKLCDDGVEREFLTCEALMWRKFPEAIEIIERDGTKGQSMELQRDSIKGHFDKKGLFHFDSALVDGLCLLGDDYTPAMTGAIVEMFSVSNIKEQMQEMITELQLYTQGGNKVPDEFALTNRQIVDEFMNILKEKEIIKDDWGYEYARYWYIDHDDDYVYVQDELEGWNKIFGFTYTINDDVVAIDFESKKRMKIVYEPMGEEVQEAFELALQRSFEAAKERIESKAKEDAANEFAEKEAEFNTQIEGFNTQIETLKTDYNTLEEETSALKEYKVQKIEQEHKEAVEAMFTRFSNELNDEDVADIKDKALDMTIEELETALYVLVGKKKATFTAPEVKPKNKITITLPEDDSPGGKSWGKLVQTTVGKK